MLNDPLMLQGPLSPGSPLQNGNLKQQIMILMIILDEGSECEPVEPLAHIWVWNLRYGASIPFRVDCWS
jgi:hypothetical protein